MVNTKEIKKLLIDCGINATQLAQEIGISTSSIYSKLNGERDMTLHEAEEIQRVLHIPDHDFGFIFMSHERHL